MTMYFSGRARETFHAPSAAQTMLITNWLRAAILHSAYLPDAT